MDGVTIRRDRRRIAINVSGQDQLAADRQLDRIAWNSERPPRLDRAYLGWVYFEMFRIRSTQRVMRTEVQPLKVWPRTSSATSSAGSGWAGCVAVGPVRVFKTLEI